MMIFYQHLEDKIMMMDLLGVWMAGFFSGLAIMVMFSIAKME